MSVLASLVRRVAPLLQPLGVCGNASLIVGILVGGAIALIDFVEGPLAPSASQLWRIWAIGALFGWFVLVMLFVALLRWSLSTVVTPALVNAFLVSGLTVSLCRALDAYAWGLWIGIVSGVVIGLLLCRLYGFAVRG